MTVVNISSIRCIKL